MGVGSGAHIAAEMWKQASNIDAVHMPYKGSADLLPNLLAARLDYGFDGPSQVSAMIKDGRIRPLAVTDSKRSAAFPDVPTMAEAGYPGRGSQFLVRHGRRPRARRRRWWTGCTRNS